MKRAFLFGGENNGKIIMVDDQQKHVNMIVDREISYTANKDPSALAEMTCNTELYVKSDMIYREKIGERLFNQLDIVVFFHDKISQEMVESIKSIIEFSLNSKWERVYI